jgi:hypothetical protein
MLLLAVFTSMVFLWLFTLMHQQTTRITYTARAVLLVPAKLEQLSLSRQRNNKNLLEA